MEPTSPSAPKSAPETASQLSADEYLASQVDAARLALAATFDDLSLDVAKMTDLRRWVRRYPWPALGTAVVAGFTVGHLVVSRLGDGEADAAASEEEHEDGSPTPASFAATKSTGKSTARKGRSGRGEEWRSKLIDSLFDVLKLAATQFVTASIRQVTRDATRDMNREPDESQFAAGDPASPFGDGEPNA